METKLPLNLLVVDDVPENLLAMRALLQGEGVTVLTADSGPAALELLLLHDVALALLDVQMPGMDGHELAEAMRGSARTRHVPIIFLTAAGHDPQRQFRGYEAGAVDYLYKPVDGVILRGKVRVFTDLHRQKRLLAGRAAELERLHRLNAAMLGALTHDLRTPLAALKLNAELLRRRVDDPVVQRAGDRIKGLAGMIGHHADHLVNLARLPPEPLRPRTEPADLGVLVRQRLALAVEQGLLPGVTPPSADVALRASFDPLLLAEAVDHLLLQAAIHAGERPLQVQLDGQARRSLVLRIGFDGALPEPVALHLFGSTVAVDGLDQPRVGPGLERPEQIARAHGGSLVGRSHEREGTWFELMLPRAV